MHHSPIGTPRAVAILPPKPSLDARRVLAILVELGVPEADALERIRGDAALRGQLGKNGEHR